MTARLASGPAVVVDRARVGRAVERDRAVAGTSDRLYLAPIAVAKLGFPGRRRRSRWASPPDSPAWCCWPGWLPPPRCQGPGAPRSSCFSSCRRLRLPRPRQPRVSDAALPAGRTRRARRRAPLVGLGAGGRRGRDGGAPHQGRVRRDRAARRRVVGGANPLRAPGPRSGRSRHSRWRSACAAAVAVGYDALYERAAGTTFWAGYWRRQLGPVADAAPGRRLLPILGHIGFYVAHLAWLSAPWGAALVGLPSSGRRARDQWQRFPPLARQHRASRSPSRPRRS